MAMAITVVMAAVTITVAMGHGPWAMGHGAMALAKANYHTQFNAPHGHMVI